MQEQGPWSVEALIKGDTLGGHVAGLSLHAHLGVPAHLQAVPG